MMNNLEMNATNQQVEYYLIDIFNFSKKIIFEVVIIVKTALFLINSFSSLVLIIYIFKIYYM